MIITSEFVAYAKQEVDIKQYFSPSETCTPKHIVFKEFTEGTKWQHLPKIIFYILMDDTFGSAIGKAANGDLGYFVELKKQ